MGDETPTERIVRLEVQISNLIEQHKARAAREWGVILSALALVGTILAKNLGWM